MGQCFSGSDDNPKGNYDYDLVVIGGGSGGIAAAKEAAKLQKKVAICDFVTPTPLGTTWGLGGTCVNVGCVPKILMHHASIVGGKIDEASSYGWKNVVSDKKTIDWGFLVGKIQSHIRSVNWDHELSLGINNAAYLNELATLVDAHTVHTVTAGGVEQSITARHILIAVGTRPKYPSIPGAKEYGITSDDLFSLPYSPGTILCVGASYVALECAGFLASFGYSVTVLARSILLRGFDQQMAVLIERHLIAKGVKILKGMVPVSIEKVGDGTPPTLKVKIEGAEGGSPSELEVNTVLFAIGRDPCTKSLNLDKVGVKVSEGGRIIVDDADRTAVKNIYAVGDVAEGRPELTPVAVKAGINLMRRLYNGSKQLTDYTNVPTTVYTPLEYGCIGLSEEDAEEKYGKSNVEVFHSTFTPVERIIPSKAELAGYAKIVCLKSKNDKLIGFHYGGPNAGEVTQGFALAFSKGCTKMDFDTITGIHPTNAEIFTKLSITKSSGKSPAREDC